MYPARPGCRIRFPGSSRVIIEGQACGAATGAGVVVAAGVAAGGAGEAAGDEGEAGAGTGREQAQLINANRFHCNLLSKDRTTEIKKYQLSGYRILVYHVHYLGVDPTPKLTAYLETSTIHRFDNSRL